MTAVNEDLTRSVGRLARLSLSDDEVKLFTAQLGQILGYVEKLQECNVTGVTPLAHPLEGKAAIPFLREDKMTPSPTDEEGRPKVLSSAPEVLYDGYKVPPIL